MGKAMQIGSGRHDVDEVYLGLLGMQLNAKMEFWGRETQNDEVRMAENAT